MTQSRYDTYVHCVNGNYQRYNFLKSSAVKKTKWIHLFLWHTSKHTLEYEKSYYPDRVPSCR